jgi:hypothetical protein
MEAAPDINQNRYKLPLKLIQKLVEVTPGMSMQRLLNFTPGTLFLNKNLLNFTFETLN